MKLVNNLGKFGNGFFFSFECLGENVVWLFFDCEFYEILSRRFN